MAKGRKGQGNGFRPVVVEREREAGTRRQACRRVPALMALVFVCAAAIFVFAWVLRALCLLWCAAIGTKGACRRGSRLIHPRGRTPSSCWLPCLVQPPWRLISLRGCQR